MVFALSGGVGACGTNGGGGIAGHHDLAGTDILEEDVDLSGIPNPTDDAGTGTHDPATCAEATMSKSYIGCDYWPTVTGNAVWSIFDYAVVVSNPGMTMANLTVSGGQLAAPVMQQVAPGTLVKIGLPWVAALKGADSTPDGASTPPTNSVKAPKGAYHLVSDVPVLVYQFNALEYKAGTGNNLQGKAWSMCPANGIPCNSYSNDASLLLPSTAMTPNYVVTGISGDDIKPTMTGTPQPFGSSYVTITATADGTMVKMQLSKTGDILKSSDSSIAAVAQNAASPAKVTYSLDAGDVLQLITGKGSGHDLTGSIIEASKPVQVIVGTPCTTNPTDYVADPIFGSLAYSCDHIEETVLPIETWGTQYGVTAPTGPDGTKQSHTVRLYGGIATSTLTITPAISGAPTSLAPGQVVRFDTNVDFFVSGDKEFAVSSEQMSGEIVQPGSLDPKGDPSLSFFSAVQQFRDRYLFLAPTDYDNNFVDVVMPDGTKLTLDGAAVSQSATAIGAGYSVVRIPVTAGSAAGAHTLTGTAPFGLQVVGYGSATSYQYPGGIDLKVIAPTPPIL
jgi:hypothetical protein